MARYSRRRKSYKPYIIGISPATDQPTLCGNKFQLLPQNGQAAVSDGTGFVANYAVNEAGNCCLPWDFNTQLLRFSANEQPTVIQAGFRTTYCLMAVQPPEVKVELALAYKDSAGQIQKADGIYRDEPTDLNTPNIDVNDVTKVRNYFLAAKIDFPTPPTFPVAVKVKVDSAALNLIPFPADTFGSKFDRSSGTNIKQFFEGNFRIQNGFEATLTLNSLPAKDQLILFDNANIVPNRVEVLGASSATNEYVPPGPKVTAHWLSACQTTDQNAQNNSTCRRNVGVKLNFKDFKLIDATNNMLSFNSNNISA